MLREIKHKQEQSGVQNSQGVESERAQNCLELCKQAFSVVCCQQKDRLCFPGSDFDH